MSLLLKKNSTSGTNLFFGWKIIILVLEALIESLLALRQVPIFCNSRFITEARSAIWPGEQEEKKEQKNKKKKKKGKKKRTKNDINRKNKRTKKQEEEQKNNKNKTGRGKKK